MQEPWGFLPHQVAHLTTQQVMELYLKPAAKRAEKATNGPNRRSAEDEPTWEVFLVEMAPHYRGKTLGELQQIHAKIHAAWVNEMAKKGGTNGRN